MVRPLLVLTVAVALVGLFGRTGRTLAGTPDRVVDVNFPDCVEGNQPTYTSLKDAVDASNVADVIYVCPSASPYVEKTITISSQLTILGPSVNGIGGTATISKSPLSTLSQAFYVTGSSVIIRGLDIDETPPQGWAAQTAGIQVLGSYGEISDNTFHGAASGLAIQAGNVVNSIDVTIARNHVISGGMGILCSCDFSLIASNTVDKMTGLVDMQVEGSNTTVQDNVITAGAFFANMSNGLIDGNTLDGGNESHTLLRVSGDPLTISNNNFKNTTNVGLYVEDRGAVGDTRATVTSNLFESVFEGIELIDSTADAYTTYATIGGSLDDHNTFTAAGTAQLLYLDGVAVPIDAEYNDWGLCTLGEIEDKIHHYPDDATLGVVDYDPFIPASTCATPTPSTTASPTAIPHAHLQGDINCDGVIDGIDALAALRYEADAPATQPSGCPAIGSGSPPFGDVDCDGGVDSGDAIALLEYEALGTQPDAPGNCTDIGQTLPV